MVRKKRNTDGTITTMYLPIRMNNLLGTWNTFMSTTSNGNRTCSCYVINSFNGTSLKYRNDYYEDDGCFYLVLGI